MFLRIDSVHQFLLLPGCAGKVYGGRPALRKRLRLCVQSLQFAPGFLDKFAHKAY